MFAQTGTDISKVYQEIAPPKKCKNCSHSFKFHNPNTNPKLKITPT